MKIMQDSWLTPEGKIIEVGKFKHNEYAKQLLIEEMSFDGYFDFMQKITSLQNTKFFIKDYENT